MRMNRNGWFAGIALVPTLLAAEPEAHGGDEPTGYWERAMGYRRVTGGVSHTWSQADEDPFARATLFDDTIAFPLPIKVTPKLFFDVYGDLGFGVGGRREAATGEKDIAWIYHADWGGALAYREVDQQVWMRIGWGGAGLLPGEGDADWFEMGFVLQPGIRIKGVGAEFQVPLGQRYWGATAILAPFSDNRHGFGLKWQGGKTASGDATDAQLLSLQWGLW